MKLSRIFAFACWLLLPAIAQAQSLNIDLGSAGEAGATGRLVQITARVTVLSLAPSLLVMVSAFTRIVIVLSLLRILRLYSNDRTGAQVQVGSHFFGGSAFG